ncbi:laccase [Pisolithus tinctorius]|uniref:Laccase n=1 Tax=Pisolithus tinctorius Marx 270 TaxID=870435 RepID=A0A0C3P3C2_PISTI|nr:laccase [Pisolithus tinctorius]KIO07530.1 laccase [Pisolithus tinctorius Marx 270]
MWGKALKHTSFLALATLASAATKDTEFVISNAVVAPDGFSRSAIVINGSPAVGPLVAANKGDNLRIKVTNDLTDESMNKSTTVHWHGIFQHHSNAMDGTAFVTQCPIAPEKSFLYNFTVDSQAGTFWYHSHFNLQYCEGLRGPLVLYDPNDPYRHLYDVDDASTILTLMDWYHVNAYDVAAADNPAGILINGLGRYPGGPNVDLSVTTVQQGKRYRMRVVNMACKPHILLSIDMHNMTVIEADGQETLPLVVNQIPVYVGQRYSFILEANQPVDNYWIRALPGSYPSNFSDGLNSGILRYEGAPATDPANRTWVLNNVLDETNLHPLNMTLAVPGLPYPGGADVSINIVSIMDNTTLLFYMNGVIYESPSTPVLLQILSGAVTASQLAPHGLVYTLPHNKVIELSFPTEFLTTPHPFHLHGHAFYVVRSANSTAYNYVNPVVRDTVNIGANTDNVTVRFVTDNSGPWFLHCHIDWHLYRGMAVVFAEDPNGTTKADPVNSAWQNLCPVYDSLAPSDQ